MVETVEKGDFVQLDYTGTVKDLNMVFDTTIESLAKENDLYSPGMTYGPVEICVGEGQILPGLDTAIEGLEIGKEQNVTLSAENAFGKKDGKLIKLIPTSTLKKQSINPVPGLQIQVDGAIGTIKTVSGGRTVIDFNHPLSGKEIAYTIQVHKKITNLNEKILALVSLAINQKKDTIKINNTEGTATIETQTQIPDALAKMLKERITKLLTEVKDVKFKTKEETKTAKQNQNTKK